MRKTVPVMVGGGALDYGLGLYAYNLPCGRYWGHSGSIFGMATESVSSPDGDRQLSMGVNLTKYQRVDENGVPLPSPIDQATVEYFLLGICGQSGAQVKTSKPPFVPFAVDQAVSAKR
jgi:D-alanyl-D-alanine carboxypeptidase